MSKQLKEKINAMKKADLDLTPGFNITAEYRLGEIRGYNQALDDVLLTIYDKGKKDIKRTLYPKGKYYK